MKPTRPEDIFRAEKERAVSVRNSQHARLLAEAKAAFDKLMAEGQAARKSGRPRKHPLPPLKTSSSRMPPRPLSPPSPPLTVAKPETPPKPIGAQAPAMTTPAKPAAKPVVHATHKRPKAAKRDASAKRSVSKSKAKSKPKRSSRR